MRFLKLPPYLYSSLIFLFFFSCKVSQKSTTNINNVKWISGAPDCKKNTDPSIQVVRYNYNTWIFRQNKCVNYEAPFLFLFLGHTKALLMDTGATKNENQFPLYDSIKKIIKEWEKQQHEEVELTVAHTHNHTDHRAGDIQFKNKSHTTVVGLSVDEVKTYFNIENWPFKNSQFDLGKRVLNIIPIPGNEQASIAVYDPETKILLSGDSFYPGRLYIRDWDAYKLSIQ